MQYEWSRSGIERAVEDAMREYPSLATTFQVADYRDGEDFTWHVELDSWPERRVARLSWQMVEYGQLAAIAEALEEAEPAWSLV